MKRFLGLIGLALSSILLLSAPAIEAQTVTYHLAPGSSITAQDPAGSDRLTEPLTGALQLTTGTPEPPNSLHYLVVTSFQFSSTSFELAGRSGLFHSSTLDPPGALRCDLQGRLNERDIELRGMRGRDAGVLSSHGGYFPQRIEASDVSGDGATLELILVAEPGSDGDPPAGGVHADVVLHDNYPNPFNPSTTIEFELEGNGDSPLPVVLEIFNATGRRVRTLIEEVMSIGQHATQWDGTDDAGHQVASGTYIYEVRTNGSRASRRMLLMK